MTHALPAAEAAPAVLPPLYRAVWRWHFYAGLFVLPFMVLLAVTGAIYLFKDEINDAMYGEMRRVIPQEGAALAPSALAGAALAAEPGTLTSYLPPAAPDRAAQVKVRTPSGDKRVVFVNPWTGAVLGTLWDGGFAGSPEMWLVRKIHSLDYVGWWASRLIEMVAGWAIVLVITGVWLWWPRGRGVGVVTIRRGGRAFWRDLHAVTGIFAAGGILFLALTGLPWSGFWGKQFYAIAYDLGLGMPDGYWDAYPTSTVPMGAAMDRAPWSLEGQPLPLSVPDGVPLHLDGAVAIVERLGIAPGYALDMPDGPEGVFTASVYPDDISGERVIHLDQYSGAVLYDVGLTGLGALGMAAEWGISVHMGQEFGLVNQLALLALCLAIIAMAVAAAAMWWKRRPAGRLGAPPVPADWRVPRVILAVALAVGLVFPLVGLSLAVMLAIDLALPRGLRARLA